MIITVDHIMMYSLVTTSHVQYLVMNDLHYFKTEHKASKHILSVNIPQPIPYTNTPRRCNLVISSLCRGILLCPLQCSRILRRSFYHRKAIMHIQSGMQENFTYPRVLWYETEDFVKLSCRSYELRSSTIFEYIISTSYNMHSYA